MIIKILKEPRRRLDEQNEKLHVFNKKLKNIKKNQSEKKNTITERKNTLEGINIRLDDTEGQISKLGDKVVEIPDAKQEKKKKRIKRNKDSLRDLWDNIKLLIFTL